MKMRAKEGHTRQSSKGFMSNVDHDWNVATPENIKSAIIDTHSSHSVVGIQITRV